MNVRGLNSEMKQRSIEQLLLNEDVDIALLTGTKLSKTMGLKDRDVIQTKYPRRSGCAIVVKP